MNERLKEISTADAYIEEITPYLKGQGVYGPAAIQFIRQFEDFGRLRDFGYACDLNNWAINHPKFKQLAPEAQRVVDKTLASITLLAIKYVPPLSQVLKEKNLSQQDA